MTDKPLLDRLLLLINELTNGNKKKFAEILGIGPSHINDWTNMGSIPNAFYLAIIHKKTGVNLHWLISGEGKKYLIPSPHAGEGQGEGIYARESMSPYGEPSLTEEERAYIKKLIQIFKTKQEKTVIAIKQNIEAFLDTPNKEKVKKNMANE